MSDLSLINVVNLVKYNKMVKFIPGCGGTESWKEGEIKEEKYGNYSRKY